MPNIPRSEYHELLNAAGNILTSLHFVESTSPTGINVRMMLERNAERILTILRKHEAEHDGG